MFILFRFGIATFNFTWLLLCVAANGTPEFLGKLDEAYWTDGNPLVSDAVYDHIVNRESVDGEYLHKKKMGSLLKGYGQESLLSWLEQNDMSSIKGLEFCLEPKLDGVGASLKYEKGYLVGVLTRGSGEKGRPVRDALSWISGIPHYVRSLSRIEDIELRGELIVQRPKFNQLKQLGTRQFTYVSPRHYVVGVLNSNHPLAQLPVEFVLHGYGHISGEVPWISWTEMRSEMLNAGFRATTPYAEGIELESLWNCVQSFREEKDIWKYHTDGIVVKLDFLKHRDELGEREGIPKWAFALKHPPEEILTHLRDIELSIGHTGRINVVGILEPVEIDGVRIRRVNLGTYTSYLKLNLYRDETVIINYKGSAIPVFKSALVELRASSSKPFELEIELGKMGLTMRSDRIGYVDNEDLHPLVVMSRMRHWFKSTLSRSPRINAESATLIVEHSRVSSFTELLIQMVLNPDLLSESQVENARALESSWVKSQQATLERKIRGIGIPYTGVKRSAKIAAFIEDAMKSGFDPIAEVKKTEDKAFSHLKEWLSEPDHLRLFRLLVLGERELTSHEMKRLMSSRIK